MIHLKRFSETTEYSKIIKKISVDNLKGILVDITDNNFEYKIIENIGEKYLVIEIIHISEYNFNINSIVETICTIEEYVKYNNLLIDIDVTYLDEEYDWHYDVYDEVECNMTVGSIKSILDLNSAIKLQINISSPSN